MEDYITIKLGIWTNPMDGRPVNILKLPKTTNNRFWEIVYSVLVDHYQLNVFSPAKLSERMIAKDYTKNAIIDPKKRIKELNLFDECLIGVHFKLLKIFICHANEDKEIASKLHNHLKKDGFDPWIDKVDLEPGVIWKEEIEDSIIQSDIVLACLSKKSVEKDGFVNKEIKYALERFDEMPENRRYLVPVKFENCDLPRKLSKIQCVNLFSDIGYQKLRITLNKVVGELNGFEFEDPLIKQENIFSITNGSNTEYSSPDKYTSMFSNDLKGEQFFKLSALERIGADPRTIIKANSKK